MVSPLTTNHLNTFFAEVFNVNAHPSIFILECVIAAAIGSFVGGIIDKMCTKLQGDKQGRCWSAIFFTIQIIFTIIFLAILIYMWKGFFNWALSSIGGVVFITLLFIVQETFQKNVINTFDV